MQVLSVLIAPAYFTDFHLFCLLVCRMVNVSMQHGTSGASAHAYGRLRDCASARSFTVIRRGIVSPGSPATWSRNMASSPTRRRSTTRWGSLPSGPSRSRPRSTSTRAAFRAASETGDLTYACYSMYQIRREPSPAQRSARRGVARVGEGPGLRPEGRVPRRRGHHREPATLHRDHAGPDRDLLHLQRRAVRRGGVRGPADGRPDDLDGLLVLDPQTEGALPVRRLRRGALRQPTRRRRCFGSHPRISSCSTTSTTPR